MHQDLSELKHMYSSEWQKRHTGIKRSLEEFGSLTFSFVKETWNVSAFDYCTTRISRHDEYWRVPFKIYFQRSLAKRIKEDSRMNMGVEKLSDGTNALSSWASGAVDIWEDDLKDRMESMNLPPFSISEVGPAIIEAALAMVPTRGSSGWEEEEADDDYLVARDFVDEFRYERSKLFTEYLENIKSRTASPEFVHGEILNKIMQRVDELWAEAGATGESFGRLFASKLWQKLSGPQKAQFEISKFETVSEKSHLSRIVKEVDPAPILSFDQDEVLENSLSILEFNSQYVDVKLVNAHRVARSYCFDENLGEDESRVKSLLHTFFRSTLEVTHLPSTRLAVADNCNLIRDFFKVWFWCLHQPVEFDVPVTNVFQSVKCDEGLPVTHNIEVLGHQILGETYLDISEGDVLPEPPFIYLDDDIRLFYEGAWSACFKPPTKYEFWGDNDGDGEPPNEIGYLIEKCPNHKKSLKSSIFHATNFLSKASREPNQAMRCLFFTLGIESLLGTKKSGATKILGQRVVTLLSRGSLPKNGVNCFRKIYDLRSHIAHGRDSKYVNVELIRRLEATAASVYRCAIHWYWREYEISKVNAGWDEQKDAPNTWYRDAVWGPSLDRFHDSLDRAFESQSGLAINLPDYRGSLLYL